MAGGATPLIAEFAARSPTKPTLLSAQVCISIALQFEIGRCQIEPDAVEAQTNGGFGNSPDLAERPIRGAKLSVEGLRFSDSPLWGRRNRRCSARFCNLVPHRGQRWALKSLENFGSA